MKTYALAMILAITALCCFSNNVCANSTTKPVKKSTESFKIPFNRKSVPYQHRLMRDWGFKVGVQGFAGTGARNVLIPIGFNISIGGYKCFLDGALCPEAELNVGFLPALWYGLRFGARWNPWTNRHYATLGVHVAFESFPVGYFNDLQWTVDIAPGILWRAFGDYAGTAILSEIVMRFGAQMSEPYPYAPKRAAFVFWFGIKFSLDFALMQRHTDGRALSVFTGRSSFNPAHTDGIYQDLTQPDSARVQPRVFKRRHVPPRRPSTLTMSPTIKQFHVIVNKGGRRFILYRGLEWPMLSDSDGDGVLNVVDKCPLHKGNSKYHGCPADLDSDGDGIPDHNDSHPLDPNMPKKK